MLSPIDTRILTARPDHLTALTEAQRSAEALLAERRRGWIAALLRRLVRRPVRLSRPAFGAGRAL